MRYLIHACPQRLWYVNDYLIPSMLLQGVKRDDIEVWNDADGRGNLTSCMESFRACAGQNQAVKGFRELLLQDKVVIEESGLALWCLKNAVEIMNNYGDLKLSKKHKDDTQRIDPVAAMMNALARALVRRNNPTLADRLEAGWTM